jgi:undecaprenyl-diphosphatase
MSSNATAAAKRRRFFLSHRAAFALVVIGLGVFGFVGLADEVMEGDTLPVDRSLLLALRAAGNGSTWLEEVFRDFTALGGVGVLGMLSLVSIGYLWLRGLRRAAAFVFAAITGGLLLGIALKTGFDRPRPDLVSHGSMVYTSSFPSGHSMLSAMVYLTCGTMLAAVHTERRVQIYLISCAIVLTSLVGISRVYLGVHWPSDVLGGWAVGAAWASGSWLAAQWLRGRGHFEPAVPAPEE